MELLSTQPPGGGAVVETLNKIALDHGVDWHEDFAVPGVVPAPFVVQPEPQQPYGDDNDGTPSEVSARVPGGPTS